MAHADTETLFHRAVAIRLSSGESAAYKSAVAELRRRSQPLSTTLAELADRYDIPLGDVIESCVAAGVRVFWHNGRPYGDVGHVQQVADWDLGSVEVDLTEGQSEAIYKSWGKQ